MPDSKNTDLVSFYVNAATRENTVRSYRAAVNHYERHWGGLLPATPNAIAQYLSHYADKLSSSTLAHRLAVLAKWHHEYGFPDPTKAPLVKQVMKGIRQTHPYQPKQARPLQLEELETIIRTLDVSIKEAKDYWQRLRHIRNKTILLLGFWRAFRADELTNIHIEHVTVIPNKGMSLYFPTTKGDRDSKGVTHKVPALQKLCPVAAYQDWVMASELTEGPLFIGIDRWGHFNQSNMTPNTIMNIVRDCARDAGLEHPESFSSHSLRRGFASWADSNDWSLKDLMGYVGWKDPKTALRYIDSYNRIQQHFIEPLN
jgi:integrase